MKKLLLVFAAAIMFASCKKQSEQRPAPEKMNGIEFAAKYGFQLPFLDYGSGVARSNKPKASAVTLTVMDGDLTISGSVSCTTSPDAEWGGIQKFLAIPLSMDGAVSWCNFNWTNTTAPASMDCPTTTSGVYRGWTSDHNYDVHLSPPTSL